MDNDDKFERAPEGEEAPKKVLNRLEQEEVTYDKAYQKLVCVMWVSTLFICCQMTGGILANSIAIFTDCAHLASDMLSFLMAMYALKVSLRPASQELTFGWHRAEIIGTLASMMFLITITLWLLVAAIGRIIEPQPVDGLKMLITAVVSLGFNLVQIKILHQGDIHYHPGGQVGGGGGCSGHDHSHGEGEEHTHTHDDTEAGEEKKEGDEHTHDHGHSHAAKKNINLDAAFLHALGDMFLSMGVAIAATIIYCCGQEYVIADPICTFVFSAIVFFTVTPIMKKCMNVLMEAAPVSIKINELIDDIKASTNAS